VFELDENDDPLDETLWIKANPNLGVSIPMQYLREEAAQAKTSPVSLNRFTRFHCNRKVSSFDRFILPDDWDTNADELSDWSNADAIGAGIDLGGLDDLASIGLVARFPIDEDDEGKTIWRYEAFSRSFMIENTLRDLKKQPWAGWVASKQLKVCKYVISSLRDELVQLAEDLGISSVAYDPYIALHLSEELSQEGLTVIRMPQNQFHFNEPMKEMASALREHRFRPDKTDTILRWCALNMMTSINAQDKMMPDKANSREKIDAIVSVLMGLKAVMLAAPRVRGPLFMSR
jgi:phage terminase large subunit-like protein